MASALLTRMNIPVSAFRSGMAVLSVLMALASAFSVYCLLPHFFCAFRKNIRVEELIRNLSKREKVAYGMFLLLAFAFIAHVFFSFPDSRLAPVYSSDGVYLLTADNAFLSLINHQNDLRQPLFGGFSAPFHGALYAVARLFPGVPALETTLMNCLQYGMVFVANILLARIMKLKTNERICFLLLTAFSYPYILFGLIVEQYMVAYFYLMLALYTLSERKERNSLVFCGVSGTLITGLVLAPLFSDASPWRNFKKWLSDMRQLLASFFVFFLASCKSLYVFLFFHQVQRFSAYAVGTSFQVKWLQYVNFLSCCLVAPTDVEFTRNRFYLTSITRLNLFGLFILVAVCVSFAFNYKDTACRYAFGWIVFSFLILCVMGWGSVENTMPLYSLYFSWACIVLLYRLFQKIAEKLRCAWILYVCCAALGLFLLYRNSQGVRFLTSFFAQFTPADILKTGV